MIITLQNKWSELTTTDKRLKISFKNTVPLASLWIAVKKMNILSLLRLLWIFFFHSILFKKFLNFTLFYFTILYWFCHTLTWICHGCTWVPNPEPPSHLPPHTISVGHPSTPAPSILYPASNLDWRFISYMILYVFQCHSPKSSHPLPLPQSPRDTDV